MLNVEKKSKPTTKKKDKNPKRLKYHPIYFTALGTMKRDFWSKDHLNRVLEVEKTKQVAICGAMTTKNDVCRNRPKPKYDHYCGNHKPSRRMGALKEGEKIQSSASVDIELPTEHNPFVTDSEIKHPQTLRSYLLQTFSRCNVCPIRMTCSSFVVDAHCSIEEGVFRDFVTDIITSYDITTSELNIVYMAGWAWVKTFKNRMIEAQFDTTREENQPFLTYAFRESREYRQCMRDLGITRSRRKHDEKASISVGGQTLTPGNVSSLAQMMSALAEAGEVTIEQKTKIKKSNKDVVESNNSYS